MVPFSAASCEQLYFMAQYVSNQGVLAAVAGCGGGGFAADFHPLAFLGFLNVPFQREPSSLSHQIYLFFSVYCSDASRLPRVAKHSCRDSPSVVPGRVAPWRQCRWAVEAEELVYSGARMEG